MEDLSAKGSTPKMYVLTSEGEESIKNMHPTEIKERKRHLDNENSVKRLILHILQSTVMI